MNSTAPAYIYADNAATTPLAPEALEAMSPYLNKEYGNPSGIHRLSRQNAQAVAKLRQSMANMLGAPSPQEIYFTSGGTESDNWIIRGRIDELRKSIPLEEPIYVITSAIEHHAILNTCKALEAYNVRTELLQPDNEGFIDPRSLNKALENHADDHVALVTVMYANNEIGTIEAIQSLATVAHKYDVPFYTDAVQAVGHTYINVEELGIDALSLSAHKFNGPHGIGALYVKSRLKIAPLMTGGGQERGMRSGTENVAAIAGMEAALKKSLGIDAQKNRKRLSKLRDRLAKRILEETEDVIMTGTGNSRKRLPGNASFCCKDVDGELLMVLLDKEGVAASTGSACNTGSTEPSHVIRAIGINDPKWNKGSLRLSLSEDMAQEEVDELADRTIRAIKKARLLSGMSF